MANRIKVWSAALPNLIADQPVIPEHINDLVRPGYLVRWAECLSTETPQRQAMLSGFAEVWDRLSTAVPPGEEAASLVLKLLTEKGRV
jgi:lipid-A-disaccharide synthase